MGDNQVLQRVSLSDVKTVQINLKLETATSWEYGTDAKQLAISNDRSVCVVGDGGKAYFYLIDLKSNAQHKLTSSTLTGTHSPCFINDEAEHVAVGGDRGQGVEIWDIKSKEAVRVLPTGGAANKCLASTNNIL